MSLKRLLQKEPSLSAALRDAGISNANQLINAAGVLEDPNELADLLGIEGGTFNTLVGRAELLAIHGMGQVYADLLAAAGIITRAQLSACDPFELHELIKQVAVRESVGRIPNRLTVEYWIEQANM